MQSVKAKKPTVCLTVDFLVHKIELWKIFLDKLYIFEKLYAIIKL